MHEFLEYTASGLATSSIYAIAASGLVLTYATTGIFNFAYGAIGMIAAFAYWQLTYGWGWPAPVALVICLVLLGPLFGALLDLLIMRRLEGAPEATRLVVTISLMVALLGLSLWIWSPEVGRQMYPFFRNDSISIAGVGVSAQEVICIAVAVVLAIGLRFFMYSTRLGIALRAGVDDRGLVRLNGGNPDRGSLIAWAIGVSLAALSGILIAPTVSLSAVPLTLLIVNAYAAAVFGKLRSIPLTFVGALILGMAGEYIPDYIQSSSANQYLQGMYLSIPVIILFIVLLVMPHAHLQGHVVARGREIVPRPTRAGAAFFAVAVVAAAAMVGSVMNSGDLKVSVGLFGLAIIGLSIVPLLGFAGQVSLCQLTLGGIGAIVMGHLGTNGNPLGLLAAALITGAVGVVISLPALRLSGIYFALATAAFAVAMDQWVFSTPHVHLVRPQLHDLQQRRPGRPDAKAVWPASHQQLWAVRLHVGRLHHLRVGGHRRPAQPFRRPSAGHEGLARGLRHPGTQSHPNQGAGLRPFGGHGRGRRRPLRRLAGDRGQHALHLLERPAPLVGGRGGRGGYGGRRPGRRDIHGRPGLRGPLPQSPRATDGLGRSGGDRARPGPQRLPYSDASGVGGRVGPPLSVWRASWWS